MEDRDIHPVLVVDSSSNAEEEVQRPVKPDKKKRGDILTAYQQERLSIKREDSNSKKEYRQFMMARFGEFIDKL